MGDSIGSCAAAMQEVQRVVGGVEVGVRRALALQSVEAACRFAQTADMQPVTGRKTAAMQSDNRRATLLAGASGGQAVVLII